MSSILKILSDVECQVYCDNELKGEAFPDKIFRIEMRKGCYILEFKKGFTCLLAKEYEMKSNDEEPLLRVTLANSIKEYDLIADLNVKIEVDFEGEWIKNTDTGEKHRIEQNTPEVCGFDNCGLLYVNEGGERSWDYDDGVIYEIYNPYYHNYAYKGGKFGCIDKRGNLRLPIIYDKPIYFCNQNVAVAQLNGKKFLINKWGETIYSDLYVWDDKPFFDGYCIVVAKGFKFALINESGKYVLSPDKSTIERSDKYSCFFIRGKERFGVFLKGSDSNILELLENIDSFEQEGNIYFSNHYENLRLYDYYVVAIRDGRELILDYKGNYIFEKEGFVPAFYRMSKYSVRPMPGYSDYEGTYEAQIVVQNGKYGCLNKDVFAELNNKDGLHNIQMIVPCEYDYVAKEDWSFIDFDELSEVPDCAEVRYFVKKEPSGDYHYYHYHLTGEETILDDMGLRPHPDSYYLFIDTETTGLLPTKHYDRYEDYLMDAPYLVQVAMLLYDKNLNKLSERNIILKPQGYSIPIESSRIHGITNSYAIDKGEDRIKVMEYIKRVYDTVNVIVGHNLTFDLEVIDNELFRERFYTCKMNDDGSCTYYKADRLIDTMKLGAEICKIPSSIRGEKYKWPTLDELYRKLFGKSFQGQHNALNDVKATYECYCKMIGKNN